MGDVLKKITLDNLTQALDEYGRKVVDKKINDAVLNATVDLTGYATEQYVDTAINNVSVDLTDYYTKGEVDTALGNVTVDMSDYYTKAQVDTALGNVTVDMTGYYTKAEVDTAISDVKQEAVEAVLGEAVSADFDTLKEVADWIAADTTASAQLVTRVTNLENGTHEHDNKTVLDSITAEKVAAWNSASGNTTTLNDLGVTVSADTINLLSGASSNIQTQITANANAIAGIDLTNYYTKTEIDTALGNVSVDLTNYYTKTEVDTAISNSSVDLTDYYTKTEVDNTISGLALGEENVIESITLNGVALTPDENGNVEITVITGGGSNTSVNVTIASTDWVNNTYTVDIANLSDYEALELTCDYINMTADQLEAMQEANITPSAITDGSLTLKVNGETPTVSLPIIVILKATV